MQTDEQTEIRRRQYPEDHPCHHTMKLKAMLHEVAEHARADVTKIGEPKAQALFETTAVVLQGLMNAYEHYESESEAAWQRS